MRTSGSFTDDRIEIEFSPADAIPVRESLERN
jgi:hypothetical protein